MCKDFLGLYGINKSHRVIIHLCEYINHIQAPFCKHVSAPCSRDGEVFLMFYSISNQSACRHLCGAVYSAFSKIVLNITARICELMCYDGFVNISVDYVLCFRIGGIGSKINDEINLQSCFCLRLFH